MKPILLLLTITKYPFRKLLEYTGISFHIFLPSLYDIKKSTHDISTEKRSFAFYLYFTKTSKMNIMKLELYNQTYMQFKTIFSKINPWIGLLGSLCLIIPSLYDILDEPLLLTTDHLILAIGIFFMVLFLKQIFDRIINLEEME